MEKPNVDDGLRKLLISAIFVTSLIVANVVTGRIVVLFGLTLPGAFFTYAITFLCTDLMSELYGKREANRLVFVGFVVSVFASVVILLTGLIPAAPFAAEQDTAYKVLLGLNWRFVGASMAAYYVSQTWDVWFFDWLGRKTKGRHKWLRNNASTMTSQAIDTVIFITIAFSGNVPSLVAMMVSQYVFKLVVAALDTPIFYAITARTKSVFE